MQKDEAVLRVELKNSQPVELADFTESMAAFAFAFKEYAAAHSGDPLPDNMRLYVKSMSEGSIIAEMVALTQQAQWLLEHADVMAGFVGNLNDIANYFLGKAGRSSDEPSAREARYVSSIVNPVAKDGGAQLNVSISGDVHYHQHFHVDSVRSNAIQNSVSRFLGPKLPASEIRQDQLMTLEQVKNDAKSQTGDRGIIETVSEKPVKLQFVSEDAKQQVLDLQDNPLQCVYVIDVEVRSVGGKPMLYRVLEVKDVIHPD